MKKIICILSAVIMILSIATACGKKSEPFRMPKPEEYSGETHVTTEVRKTVGTEVSSTRVETGEKNYEINYVDENGLAVKTEYYVNDVLKYYYVVTGTDDFGNSVRQAYYDADDNLIATIEDGYFYDKDGKQISEEMMDYILRELDYQ